MNDDVVAFVSRWWRRYHRRIVVGSCPAARRRHGLGRASHFVEGHFIDTERLPPIPSEFVGRMLSPIEARQLEDMLNRKPRDRGAERGRRSKTARP